MASQSTTSGGSGELRPAAAVSLDPTADAGFFTTQIDGQGARRRPRCQKLGQSLLTNPVIALFTECGQGHSRFFNQGWYDNVIAVDPVDPDRVWAGGIDLFRSENGGQTWGTAGYWWFDHGIDPTYHHADQHVIVFHPQYNGTSNRVMFSASDGGVDRIDDARAPVNTTLRPDLRHAGGRRAAAWIDRNNGYVTTQFYDGAVYPDGQTLLRRPAGQRHAARRRWPTPTWTMLRGGDGGYVAVDTLGDANPGNDVLFAREHRPLARRSPSTAAPLSSTPPAASPATAASSFIAPFAMNGGNASTCGRAALHLAHHQPGVVLAARHRPPTDRRRRQRVGRGGASRSTPNRVLVGMSDGCYHYNHAAPVGPEQRPRGRVAASSAAATSRGWRGIRPTSTSPTPRCRTSA